MDNEKEIRPVILKDDGKEYTLEFNADSVRFAEARGFNVNGNDILTKGYQIFYYSFRMHHPYVTEKYTRKIIDEDWGGVGGIPEGLIERLIELYMKVFECSLTEEERKNCKVTVEF